MLRDAETADPFGLASTPSAYVSRTAIERALCAFDEVLIDGKIPGLIGPPGLGKTLLLQRIAARLDDRTAPVYVPYSSLDLRELCTLILGLVEEPVTHDPVAALQQIVAELGRQRASVLLLIDDAAMMPIETALELSEWVDVSKGALKLALAAIDSHEAHEVFECFGDRLTRIRLEEEMTLDETCEYIQRRLSIVGSPQSMRDAFDDETIRRIYRESQGNPRAVNIAAQSVVRAEIPFDAPRLDEVYSASARALMDEASTLLLDTPVLAAPVEAAADQEISAEEEVIIEEPPLHDEAAPATESNPVEEDEAAAAVQAAIEELESSSYRVVRGRKVKNADGDLGAYEGRATMERIPFGASTRAARVKESELAASADASDPDGQSFLVSALLGAGDALTKRPIVLVGSLIVAISFGLTCGTLIGPTSVTAPPHAADIAVSASSAAPVAEVVPVAYPIGINATPWARIVIDGEKVGETPLAGVELTAGTHVIRAHYPDGAVRERTVEIDATTRSVIFE